jgi:4-diphosphocytidyl-2-C-methyl-D-erythritol kinase
MIVFPHAKINLGLHVKSRRPDGYHEIETVLYPIGWRDALEALPATLFSFQSSGQMNWNADDDLCVKAFRLIEQRDSASPVSIFRLKNIPVGAGLGGGSADAAFTLRLINNIQRLGLTQGELSELAAQVGSDCPFFLQEQPRLAEGTGTELSPAGVDLSGYHLVVAVPGTRIDTAWAYARVRSEEPRKPLREIVAQPLTTWKTDLRNDFEEVVFSAYPEVGAIKGIMYASGAVYASLSGSGSAVYGLFASKPNITWAPGVFTYAEHL